MKKRKIAAAVVSAGLGASCLTFLSTTPATASPAETEL
jgi:hypothetical protein